jgi:hypothetical protein
MSGEKDLSCGETTPGSCIMTIRHFMNHYWFLTFWLTRTQLRFLSHPTRLTWLRQTFSYFPNWNPLWMDDFRRFKRLRKIRSGVTRDSEKGVPGQFPEVATTSEAVHQCRRGVLRRRSVSHSCRHSQKNYKKIYFRNLLNRPRITVHWTAFLRIQRLLEFKERRFLGAVF